MLGSLHRPVYRAFDPLPHPLDHGLNLALRRQHLLRVQLCRVGVLSRWLVVGASDRLHTRIHTSRTDSSKRFMSFCTSASACAFSCSDMPNACRRVLPHYMDGSVSGVYGNRWIRGCMTESHLAERLLQGRDVALLVGLDRLGWCCSISVSFQRRWWGGVS